MIDFAVTIMQVLFFFFQDKNALPLGQMYITDSQIWKILVSTLKRDHSVHRIGIII